MENNKNTLLGVVLCFAPNFIILLLKIELDAKAVVCVCLINSSAESLGKFALLVDD